MQTCQSCQTGQLHREYIPYIQFLNGQMMIVPDMPALVCDNCQEAIHDTEYVNQIEQLLDKRLVEVNRAPINEQERSLIRDLLFLSPPNG